MYIKNSYIALSYRIISFIICLSGILRHLSLTDKLHNQHMFSFFTIQSNLLCLIIIVFFIYDTILEISDNNNTIYRYYHPVLRGMCIQSIFMTFIIFQFVLKRTSFCMYSGVDGRISTNDIFVHYLVPFIMITDWILFQPKGQWKRFYPFCWLLMPYFYFTSIMIRGLFITNSYPYFFLDINVYGLDKFLFYSFVLLLVFLITGYIIFIADRIMYLIPTRTYRTKSHM